MIDAGCPMPYADLNVILGVFCLLSIEVVVGEDDFCNLFLGVSKDLDKASKSQDISSSCTVSFE